MPNNIQSDWRAKPPPHPSVMIQQLIAEKKLDMTQDQLAERLGVSRGTVNRLMRQRQALSAEMALRLERLTSVSALTWLSIQAHYDLFRAEKEHRDKIAAVEPLSD